MTFVCRRAACGATFERPPGKGKALSYCCTRCRDLDRAGRPLAFTQKVVRVKPCGSCGRYFSPTREGRHGSSYCCDACGEKGKKANLYKVSLARSKVGRDIIRKRDGFRCRVCGFGYFTHVHHILPRREGGGNTADNLICLCPNHHMLVHAGLLTADELKRLLDEAPRFEPFSGPWAALSLAREVA